MTDTAIERTPEDEQNRHETLYDQTLAGIDMNRLVFRGDRRALVELLADAELSSTVNRLLAELKPHNARKELLTKALKISRGMMLTSSLLEKFSGEETLFGFIDDSGKGHRR